MTDKRVVFGYVRVSTEQQAVEGVSMEAQETKIRAWADLNGSVLQGTFIDAGVSGKRADNRPQLQEAIQAVTARSGILLVYSLSRLARSTKDTLLISERLEKAGADLVSLSEKIDTTSAAGKMVFRILAVLAEFERDLVAERTRSALQHMKSRGSRTGQIPYGFVVDTDGSTLLPSPKEQSVINLVLELRRSGFSIRQIAAELVRKQLPNKTGQVRWNQTQVHRLLTKHAGLQK